MASSKERRSEPKNEDGDDTRSSSANLSQVADRAKEAVKERLGERIDRSAGDLGLLAQTLSLASQQLKDNIAGPYVGKVATQVERFSKLIQEADPMDLLEGAQSLGRKQPLMFLGGAFALGLAGGRFLKSSAEASSAPSAREERRSEPASTQTGPAPRRTAGIRT